MRFPPTALPLIVLSMLLAAGCGGSSSTGGDGSVDDTRQVAPRTPTSPKADEDLADELGSAGTALTEAGCEYGSFPEEEARHVDDAKELDFGTFPPTSGTHFPDWGPFGVYDEQVQDGYAVHTLEHGGVVVWFGSEVDDATRKAVEQLADDDEKWMMMPRRDVVGLSSAAWTKLLNCPPAALTGLGPDATAAALNSWYEAVVSTGSAAEKDIPAYAGSMKEPTPERDISSPPPNQ